MSRRPKQHLASLRKVIAELEQRFLQDYLAGNVLPVSRGEHVEVSAYLVLSHAAFEGHFEVIAQWLLERAVESWTKKRRISRATICLLLQTKKDFKKDGRVIFDQIRLALEDAKAILSRLIRVDNHGISLAHLRGMFTPLGVDVPDDVTLRSSLAKLTNARGERAHNGIGATVIIGARDARQLVWDCLKMCELVTTAAIAIKP